MTIYSFPSVAANTVKWSLVTNSQTFESPLSKTTQTASMPGARWQANITWKNKNSADRRELMVFQANLDGSAGRCYLSPTVWEANQGAGGGTPLVKGASQTGMSLIVDGATPNVTGWLKKGDYFSFDSGGGRELKLVTADINTNGSGEATITFRPPIRTSPSDNAAVDIVTPSAIMRLLDDNQAQWTLNPPVLADGGSVFVESFPS